MLNLFTLKNYRKALLIALPLALSACGDDTKEVIVEVPATIPTPVDVSYEVTVTNLTNSQPISPPAVVLHTQGTLWSIGDVPSVALERIAEQGDPSEFLTLGIISAGGDSGIAPGDSQTISITVQDITDAKLTIAAMLGNTNDTFSGLSAWDLSQLEVGDSWTTTSPAYDAGTEANTETAQTVPGPAASGEGFNPKRNDTGYISMHPGVVSSDDGLTTSVLTSQHKFDNPVIRIEVKRAE